MFGSGFVNRRNRSRSPLQSKLLVGWASKSIAWCSTKQLARVLSNLSKQCILPETEMPHQISGSMHIEDYFLRLKKSNESDFTTPNDNMTEIAEAVWDCLPEWPVTTTQCESVTCSKWNLSIAFSSLSVSKIRLRALLAFTYYNGAALHRAQSGYNFLQ